MRKSLWVRVAVLGLVVICTGGMGTVSSESLPIQNQQRSAESPVLADFEGGVPAGWFQYGDGATTVTPTVATVGNADSLALPGQVGSNDVLSVSANVPTWAGFGATFATVLDFSGGEAVSFWFHGETSGHVHQLEIQTVPGDDRRASFVEDFTGWRLIVLPFHTFGVGGAWDITQVDTWVFVLDGYTGTFSIDDLKVVDLPPVADFEGGVPVDWFQYGDGGTTITSAVTTVGGADPTALPGQLGPNDVLDVTANVPTWGGFGAALAPVQDWSAADAVSFWFYGASTGTTHEFEIQTSASDDRRATFVENFAGWRLIVLPFATFGAGGAYDVSQVDNWVFVLDGTVGSFLLDSIQLVQVTEHVPVELMTFTIVNRNSARPTNFCKTDVE